MRVDLTTAVNEQPESHRGESDDQANAFLAALGQFFPTAQSVPDRTPSGTPGTDGNPGGISTGGATSSADARAGAGVPNAIASNVVTPTLTRPTGIVGMQVAPMVGAKPQPLAPTLSLIGVQNLPITPKSAPASTGLPAADVAPTVNLMPQPLAPTLSLIGVQNLPITPKSAPASTGLPAADVAPTVNLMPQPLAPTSPVDAMSTIAIPSGTPGRRLGTAKPAGPGALPDVPDSPTAMAASTELASPGRAQGSASSARAGDPGAVPVSDGFLGLRQGTNRIAHAPDKGLSTTEPAEVKPSRAAESWSEPTGLPAVGQARAEIVVTRSLAARIAPQVQTQIAPYITALRHGPDGTHQITVLLHPVELGQVQVVVELRSGTVNLELTGAHGAAHEALLSAMPALRRELTDAGLTVGRTDVLSQNPGTAGGATSSHLGSGGRPAPETWSNRASAPATVGQLAPEPPSTPQWRVGHSGAVDVTI
jgi:flagellar hook-length control protein FliK